MGTISTINQLRQVRRYRAGTLAGLFLATVFFIQGSSLSAQVVTINVPTDSSYYMKRVMFLKDRYFYLQPGVVFPQGRFGQLPSRSASLLDAVQDRTGNGAAMGYSFEFGYRRAFKVDHSKNSRIYPFWGLGLGFAYHPVDWRDLGERWQHQAMTQFAQGAGVGHLGVAVKHNAKWVLEGYIGLVIPIATAYPDIHITTQEYIPLDFALKPVVELVMGAKPGMTAGITWHTRHFRIGAEWFRHLSTVDYVYREQTRAETPVKAYFDWQAIRPYIGIQF